MQVIADRLFTLAQRDQATPVVKVLCRDVQQCRHARTKTYNSKKANTNTHTQKVHKVCQHYVPEAAKNLEALTAREGVTENPASSIS